jgi:hypothetical protein
MFTTDMFYLGLLAPIKYILFTVRWELDVTSNILHTVCFFGLVCGEKGNQPTILIPWLWLNVSSGENHSQAVVTQFFWCGFPLFLGNPWLDCKWYSAAFDSDTTKLKATYSTVMLLLNNEHNPNTTWQHSRKFSALLGCHRKILFSWLYRDSSFSLFTATCDPLWNCSKVQFTVGCDPWLNTWSKLYSISTWIYGRHSLPPMSGIHYSQTVSI